MLRPPVTSRVCPGKEKKKRDDQHQHQPGCSAGTRSPQRLTRDVGRQRRGEEEDGRSCLARGASATQWDVGHPSGGGAVRTGNAERDGLAVDQDGSARFLWSQHNSE
jgi:hypothetical protein